MIITILNIHDFPIRAEILVLLLRDWLKPKSTLILLDLQVRLHNKKEVPTDEFYYFPPEFKTTNWKELFDK